MNFLTKDHLKKLNIPRLENVLKRAQKAETRIYSFAGPRCCELCKEYIGDDWDGDVVQRAKPFTEYKKMVISILKQKQSQVKTR